MERDWLIMLALASVRRRESGSRSRRADTDFGGAASGTGGLADPLERPEWRALAWAVPLLSALTAPRRRKRRVEDTAKDDAADCGGRRSSLSTHAAG